VSDAEKAAAFDDLAEALTNQWHDGLWSWWCYTMCGGPKRATQVEAIADLIEWGKRMAVFMRKKRALIEANVSKLNAEVR
jgi:hypothetical protein